jgi:gliding motility-associated-like protein
MRVCLFFILSLSFVTAGGQTSPPSLQWQHSIGGSLADLGYDIQSTPDGGFITAGSSASSNGDLTQNKGLTDGWVIKFNAAGNIQWQKNYGGNYYDDLVKIKVVPGGGYIAAGYTSSSDGDVSGIHGGTDMWVTRLDDAGNLLWQKCLGGSLNEFAGSVYPTLTGGFIICGNTTSNDGDVTGLHPSISNLGDAWVVNLDGSGNILWQHCYGGSMGESAGIIEQTADGGFIFTCFSSSNDGDVSGNLNGDYWLVKLNMSGNITWQKCFGGNGGETPYGLVQVTDGYVMAGVSFSDDGFIHNYGSGDSWIVKADLNGNLLWQKNYGGNGLEIANSITKAGDGGFFIAAESKSSDGNLCKNYGLEDYWIFKLTSTGDLQWQRSFGGTIGDHPQDIIEAADGSLFITGFSSSSDNDITNNHGSSDEWLIKLSFDPSSMISVSITASENNICSGKNINFTATPVNTGIIPSYHWYVNAIEQPAAISNVFSSAALRDGDLVLCKIKYDLICDGTAEAESNSIKIIIDTMDKPSGFLPKEIMICEGVPQELISLKTFTSYLWSTGATTSSISVSRTGIYWLEVLYNNFCKSREYINVLPKKCPQSFYFPTAFTPNNDGNNDVLKPVIYGLLLQYNLTIYNRWGQIILISTDPAKGWDGKWQGKLQTTGTYIWMCNYQLAGEKVRTAKGTVTVIR